VPNERLGVFPRRYPGADRRLPLFGRTVRASPEPFIGELDEPPFDEI
jgi:hypothetical protein